MAESLSGQGRSESCVLIGYPSWQDGPIWPARDSPRCPREKRFKSFFFQFWPYNLILYCPSTFNHDACMLTKTFFRSVKMRQRTWPKSSHLDLSNPWQEAISRSLHMYYNLKSTLSRENVFLYPLISRENIFPADVRIATAKKKWRPREKALLTAPTLDQVFLRPDIDLLWFVWKFSTPVYLIVSC